VVREHAKSRAANVTDSSLPGHGVAGGSATPPLHRVSVRIGIISESFPPDVNGVAHSVLRVAEHLLARGHQPMVIAPQPPPGLRAPETQDSCPVHRVPSVPLPGYRTFRLGLSAVTCQRWLAAHRADLVHLASPFVLGARGAAAARRLGLPVAAVYQTDVPGYARAYHGSRLAEAAAWAWLRRIHNAADRTLAPSTASADRLRAHGIERVWMSGRGVDCARFMAQRWITDARNSLGPQRWRAAGWQYRALGRG
jgi:phosphatidylinositol alpha 1,6-mannosyltransferase